MRLEATVFSLLTLRIQAFPLNHPEVGDEVAEPRFPDYNDPNGLDANEIYDHIMELPEMSRTEKRFFEPSQMVSVFRSEHSPTEVAFSAHTTTTPPPPRTLPTSTARPLPVQPPPAFLTTAAPKPVHIQRNRGPTFNCRVLNPEFDGRASVTNDFSCEMLFPGIPKDESCKCLYEVEARDTNGCATGYVYTCSRVR